MTPDKIAQTILSKDPDWNDPYVIDLARAYLKQAEMLRIAKDALDYYALDIIQGKFERDDETCAGKALAEIAKLERGE